MNATLGWIQLALYLGLLLVITKPLGLYLVQVLDANGRTRLDPILKPLERLTYWLCGVDAGKEQHWKHYTISMLIFSLVGTLATYAILRLQAILPFQHLFNPQGFPAVPDHLAFNTAMAFATNTDWQSYGGENTMSYFSQMVALASGNFFSAAVGIAIAAALVRGIARDSSPTIGNFWVDLVRITYYLLLPICLVYAIFLVSQGMIQNFKPYDTANLTEQETVQVQKTDANGNPVKDAKGNPVMVPQVVSTQSIPEGPMASQMAIKMLGTNGGGYTNANAAHPFENPTPFSNFIQMLSIFAIASALTYYLGVMVKNLGHGWSVWAAMCILFLAGFFVCWHYEAVGNPILTQLGVNPADGNMEGKEIRFGITNSALFATVTTDASCGAVNGMHDSFMPLGGLVPMVNIMLGEVIFGGVGAGLYGMLIFVVLAVFIAGLMVGRTPEYLGKKIESFDVKMAMLYVLIFPLSILGFSAVSLLTPSLGLPGITNPGPHGLSQILYAYTSATGNNGSAFGGINANTHWYNLSLGTAMLVGRFFMIVPMLAVAGNLAKKKLVPPSPGTFPVHTPLFTVLLIGVILIVGALTFFPALSLGPILEHLLMHAGKTF
jgi:K+-transporting ATPase ATPase A chain